MTGTEKHPLFQTLAYTKNFNERFLLTLLDLEDEDLGGDGAKEVADELCNKESIDIQAA